MHRQRFQADTATAKEKSPSPNKVQEIPVSCGAALIDDHPRGSRGPPDSGL
jgi:hypothetical protein